MSAFNAIWSLGMESPHVIGGRHPRMTPRIWTISIRAECCELDGEGNMQCVRDKWLIKPRHKLTLYDLHDLVLSEVEAFKREHGGYTGLSWIANGR